MTKDMILHTMTKKLVRNWRTRVLSAAYSSSLTGALTQGQDLCADEITARASRDYGSCPTRLRLVVSMLLMITLGSVSVWGQEGVWYIANDKGLESETSFDYNTSTTAERFYIVPAKDPVQADKRDAYYSESYDTSDGDPEKPYLTTYRTNRDVNSAWVIKSDGNNKYFLIHVLTGKYAVYNTTPDCVSKSKPHRKVIHLETLPDPENVDKAKFYIENGTTTYTFRPQSLSSGNRYFNPSNGNMELYHANGGDCNNAGLIGVFNDAANRGSKWHIEEAQLTAPTISSVDDNNIVTVTDANGLPNGYKIRYTTDGSIPTASSPIMEGKSYTVTSSHTLKAVVERYGIVLTEVAEKAVAPAPCATPVITFDYTTSNVSISCATPNSTIYYTIDGSTPTTSSTPYNDPFSVDGSTTVKAIATHATKDPSAVAELAITQVATPTIQNNGSNAISITTTTPDATIFYTTDGSIPTTSSTEYSSPLTDNISNVTIKAIAVKANMIPSAVGSGTVKLQCATPVITRNGLTFTLSCSMPTDATFYYSLNGSDPATPYNGAVSVTSDQLPITLKAVAKHNDYTDSETASLELKNGEGTPEDPYLIYGSTDFSNFVTNVNSGATASASYKLGSDVSASGLAAITTEFTGTFDGDCYTISGLSHPLFNTINSGTVKNVILDNVSISENENGNAGAICGEATGDTRIYNCGVLATGSTANTDKDGYTEITTCSSTISGSGYVGGIVGLLDGSSRVINCFSYANITGGNKVGGIVGWNNVATTSTNLATMVMNCMFYGDITGGDSKAPIYNGEIITNDGDADGVNNFNYFWAGASYVQEQKIDNARYNCALAAETRFLQRFEFFRHLLNSNRELAAWWATGSYDNKDEMMKWVMEPSQIGTATPYPILKAPDRYPSVVNIDVNHSETYKGRDLTVGPKLGSTLSVTIRNSTTDAVYGAPTGANITTPSLSLNIMDKDPDHFNFNYGKVQLPYYNDVGTKNYTGYRVVTGWKIVSISDGTTDYSTDNDNNDATPADAEAEVDANGDITLTTPYNFADRKCTQKDLYGTGGSNRVFSQGAYWDVPEGVTAITIEPYWGKAAYLSDAYWDVTYKNGTGTDNTKAGSTVDAMTTAVDVTSVGGGQHYSNGVSTFNDQLVYTSMSNAIASSGSALYSGVTEAARNGHSVYDYAVVLVGNYHHNDNLEASNSKPYTVTSVDLDGDNEPDYSYILRFNGRLRVHPVRIDFLNAIGLGMAQKSTGGTGTYNFGIMQPKGWFESTNTSVFRFTQFEYDFAGRIESPMILQGGVIEQWVTVGGSEQTIKEAKSVSYYHVGGNVWFKEFHIGVHQDKTQDEFHSPHPPISVTGGDFDEFYLTGLYNTPNENSDDNAECYINGGRFGKVAGTGMQGIGGFTMTNVDGKDVKTAYSNGNIIWQIDNADIDEFYAGGINAAHIAEGNIYTVITNSRVDQFCGGPKFGNMNSDKKVVTNAENCTFRAFFGAGYGGNSYNRRYPSNQNNKTNINWNSWLTGNASYNYSYDSDYGGVETRIDYQFLPMSSNILNVARLFVDHVSFSLATTHDVTSKLTGCTITTSPLGRLSISDDYKCLGSFYGGGSLGKVAGPVKSTLTNCTVEGNVFGGGYSATLPIVKVMNQAFQTQPHYDENLGTYLEAKLPATVDYTWEHASNPGIDRNAKKLYTTEDLTDLGKVEGNVILNIDGNTTLTDGKVMSVTKSVYGGGEESNVAGNTQVNITGGTISQNVFGGGKGEADNFLCDKAMVGDNDAGKCADPGSEVIEGPGSVANKDKGTTVTISNGQVNGNVYGGGEVGRVEWNTQVKIGVGTGNGPFAPIIEGSVFGAGKGKETHGYAALVRGNSTVTIQGNAKVKANVYGGGEQSTVGRYWVKGILTTLCSDETAIPTAPEGLPNEMPYKTRRGGKSTVIIQGSAQIGPDDAANISNEAGHVFGAGKGVTPNYVHTGDKANWSRRMVDYNSEKHTGTPGTTWDYYPDDHSYVWEYFATEDKYLEFLQTLALVTGTDVTIGGGTVKGNVYGGSESGFVQDDTDVEVSGGTIGTEGTTTYGNVFGGGKGLPTFAEAGKVKGNATVAVSNGTIKRNVYGGGELGHVGTFTETADGRYIKNVDDMNTGLCTVSITGGKIGPDNNSDQEIGNVFGAGKGKDDTFKCEKAMTMETSVSIGGGTVNGNVYGGGEVGRVEYDTKVIIGRKSNETTEGSGTGTPQINGSVFGAGRGVVTHGYSALVRGNTRVDVEGAAGATVNGSVFGGGEIASVGRYGLNAENMPNILLGGGTCVVNVRGSVVITGNVFGAGQGVDPSTFNATGTDKTKLSRRMTVYTNSSEFKDDYTTETGTWELYDGSVTPNIIWEYYQNEGAYSDYLQTLALATAPNVTIDGNAQVKGSVFGGGELGLTKGSVTVTIQNGTIGTLDTSGNPVAGTGDVYGGGSLANTNTTHYVGLKNADESPIYVEEVVDGKTIKYIDTKEVHPTTIVRLTGGEVYGDAYGGGLGRLASGDVEAVEAVVVGDVLVDLNGTTNVATDEDGGRTWTANTGTVIDPVKKGCIVRRVFGCNNLNGTPQKNVTVHVYATQNAHAAQIANTAAVEASGDDPAVPAVENAKVKGRYDITAVYGGGNEAAYIPETPYTSTTPNGSKSQVIIDGCDYSSIETVYGGGNAAPVPESNVEIRAAYEIGYVFGGGNGKDKKSDGSENPGADIGLKSDGTPYGTGNANSTLEGGLIHEAYGGSNQKGVIKGSINQTSNPEASNCELDLRKVVGAGKYADIDQDVNMILSCQPEKKVDVLFAGADEANVNGNITLTITNGNFGQVFGGNNLGGAVKGRIIVNVEEKGCRPINIDELYLCGNNAAYSVYGYYQSDEVHPVTGKKILKPRESSDDERKPVKDYDREHDSWTVYSGEEGNTFTPYDDPVLNVVSCTHIGQVFGGGYGTGAIVYGNPTVNINMIQGKYANGIPDKMIALGIDATEAPNTNNLGIIGDVYGGGNAADVIGNPTVNIGTESQAIGAYISGNVYGGGKGSSDTYACEKAMIGKDGDGIDNPDGGTTVRIYKGLVRGNVYGGGEIGRVEKNTAVTIGAENGTDVPVVMGDVFGAGKGLETHGYAALVRGNPTVTIQGKAKVLHSVYGGGQIASVARYQLVDGVPVALAETNGKKSGYCTVNILGDAVIGPDKKMVMHHMDEQGNTVLGDDGFPLLPDDAGHVFAAGKGVLPIVYDYAKPTSTVQANYHTEQYEIDEHMPKRMMLYKNKKSQYWEYADSDFDPTGVDEGDLANQDVWEYFPSEKDYFDFVETLALATQTNVTISGNAFVKGSVYGGSENGLVQYNTNVMIEGECQIGCGKNTTDRHPAAVWGDNYTVPDGTDLECASWEYDSSSGAPYDPNAKYLYNGKYYYDENHENDAAGGSIVGKDGHTYYGNVFGGGSGSVPYFDTNLGKSRYIMSAGWVKGNTNVTINGGHILTNVYGGNEATNVDGTATVTMTGGTIGVPRTPQQIKDHPVTCYLFGAGKGDQRIFFNKETNVNDVIVNVEDGRIYGSVFGGGEDGHVLRNTTVTIGKTDGTGPTIGTVGSTYVDGNVFGGGRGFGGEALTAGNVGGAVDLIINGGEMLGSIYGGGRLASVGYGLYLTTEDGYGVMRKDDEYDGSYPNPSSEAAGTFYTKGRGHIKVTVNGGTIGKEFADDTEGEHSGNVFGGSMGRLTKLDGTPFDRADHWALLATAKSTTVNINGGTIKRSVYGGGEMGTVTTDAIVNVSGGTIGTENKGGAEFGNVYGGGKGYVDPAGSNYVTAGIIKGNTKVTVENGTNTTPTIYHNIYGGGAYGSVGTFDLSTDANKATYHVPYAGMPVNWTTGTGTANVTIKGGNIGEDGKEDGMVFGSSRGDVGAPGAIHDKLAWVYDAKVVIGTSGSQTGPQINGSVYGSGENGHVFHNAEVDIHGGTVGIDTDNDPDGGAAYPYRGNVYGGGCGTDTYTENGKKYFNPLAGIVLGNATVKMDGGHVVRTVYGGGAMGSVGTFTYDNNASNDIPDGKPVSCLEGTAATETTPATEGTGLCTVTISGGKIGPETMTMPNNYGNVFGAGRGEVHDPTLYPNMETSAFFNKTEVTITDNAFVKGSVYGGSESGHVLKDTWVKIQGGQIGCGKNKTDPYTDNDWKSTSLAPCVSWNYEEDGLAYDPNASDLVDGDWKYADRTTSTEGGAVVATDGHTFYGNVFGGGSGYFPYTDNSVSKWVLSAGRVEGNTVVDITGGHILTNVYGGNECTDVLGSSTVNMSGGTIGVPRTKGEILQNPALGYLFGAGKGDKRVLFNTWTNVASTSVNVTGGTIYGSVYGGGEDGHVLGDAVTTINQSSTEHPTVIGVTGESGYDGNVFGGGQGSTSALTAGVVGGNVDLKIQNGQLYGSVYGGGRLASVGTYFTDPNDPNYGSLWTTEPEDHGNISVSLTGGTVTQNVFGGGMGTTDDKFRTAARLGISRNVTVDLNKDVPDDARGCVVGGSIFGCNNLNTSPRGTVTVHIHKTQNAEATTIANPSEGEKTAKVMGRFDVKAVYGGGNMAAYEPDALIKTGTDAEKEASKPAAKVIIDGCDLTSIRQVYGGGNAASTPATDVEVNGTYEIFELFGGGNGADDLPDGSPNPGANVGYKDYHLVENDPAFATKDARVNGEGFAEYRYGTGVATVNIKGGTIHRVFGGSNTKGNVRQTALTLLEESSGCPFCVDEAYGGGKSAPMDAEAKLHMACIPGLKAAYGGAEAADIQGDVTLNITNGTFERVFGGNNISGTIRGAITVNIEETGCKPIIIGELYGGGNQAGYSVYGYKKVTEGITEVWKPREPEDGMESGISNRFQDPQVNIKSFTSIGEVYGGGFGEKAEMVGNPHVNINVTADASTAAQTYTTTVNNQTVKAADFAQKTITIDEDKETEHTVILPSHTAGEMGAINNVFGGGNAAKVVGDTYVNIGTLDKVIFETPAEASQEARTKTVMGADIRGNVYGGGNKAEVTGKTNVVVGKRKE